MLSIFRQDTASPIHSDRCQPVSLTLGDRSLSRSLPHDLMSILLSAVPQHLQTLKLYYPTRFGCASEQAGLCSAPSYTVTSSARAWILGIPLAPKSCLAKHGSLSRLCSHSSLSPRHPTTVSFWTLDVRCSAASPRRLVRQQCASSRTTR